jgi:hypothetical protein
MNTRTFKTKVDDKEIEFLVRAPSLAEQREGQKVYNQAFSDAVKAKAIVRARMDDLLEEQGLWDSSKQAKLTELQQIILDNERALAKGGIPLKKAKSIALELKRLRVAFREVIAERTAYDNNTAEGVADNARFDYLVSVCILDPSTETPVFKNIDDYNERGAEPWAIKAAGELANFLYNLDPNYEKNLPENEFLKKFRFTDSEGRLVNKEGHLISVDETDVERLIDKDGYFVAYNDVTCGAALSLKLNPVIKRNELVIVG